MIESKEEKNRFGSWLDKKMAKKAHKKELLALKKAVPK